MALSYKARRRLSFLILLVGMPAYLVAAITLVGLMDRARVPLAVEFVMYVVLGVAWVLPFRSIFRGTAKPDPDAPPPEGPPGA